MTKDKTETQAALNEARLIWSSYDWPDDTPAWSLFWSKYGITPLACIEMHEQQERKNDDESL